MKQIDIVKAYKLLESFANVEGLTDKELWSLYQLRLKLRSSFDFYAEREQAIKDKYMSFVSEDGRLEGKPYFEYLQDVESLNNTEIELEDLVKPTIRLIKGINFIAAEQLSDFIQFVPGE